IVKAVIEIGRSFGLQVVAEGIESGAQLTCLRRLGADQLQGFHIARPKPAAEVERWMAEYRVA
ncbi:MAG: EAL domain-containing protein, partial [Alphaproteobacteria bacterium]|nr:EAL domain-containing protein [Alphaproteobacteria bacterium]